MLTISLWDLCGLDQLSIMPRITRKFLSSPLFLGSMNVVYKSPFCLSAQGRCHEELALSNLGEKNSDKTELTVNLSSATQWQEFPMLKFNLDILFLRTAISTRKVSCTTNKSKRTIYLITFIWMALCNSQNTVLSSATFHSHNNSVRHISKYLTLYNLLPQFTSYKW